MCSRAELRPGRTSAQRLSRPCRAHHGRGRFRDFVVEQWRAINAPAKTPAAIVQRLNREIAAALKIALVMPTNGRDASSGWHPSWLERSQADSAKWAGSSRQSIQTD